MLPKAVLECFHLLQLVEARRTFHELQKKTRLSAFHTCIELGDIVVGSIDLADHKGYMDLFECLAFLEVEADDSPLMNWRKWKQIDLCLFVVGVEFRSFQLCPSWSSLALCLDFQNRGRMTVETAQDWIEVDFHLEEATQFRQFLCRMLHFALEVGN